MNNWTHQLYPKWKMELTLQKIEILGKKNYVKNTLNKLRNNDLTDEYMATLFPDAKADEEVIRRGDAEEESKQPEEDPFFDPFDEIARVSDNPCSIQYRL